MEGKVFDVVRFDREMGGGVHGVHGSSYTGRRRESSKRGGRKRATGRGCTWRGRYAERRGKPTSGGGRRGPAKDEVLGLTEWEQKGLCLFYERILCIHTYK